MELHRGPGGRRTLNPRRSRLTPALPPYHLFRSPVQCRYARSPKAHEYCGNFERHEYQLYLALNDIDHTKTKVKSPQTNGICERFHKTILGEFYQVAFRKKIYSTLEELQRDLDDWLDEFNNRRPHQGKRCDGKTPYATWTEGKEVARLEDARRVI